MPRAWRVAYVIGELGNGGAEYQLYELVRGLDRTRVDPTVLVLAAGGYWAARIRDLRVVVEEIAGRGSADLGRLRRLRAALRRLAPDVLHTVLWSGNCYGRMAALGLGIPVVIAAERNVIARPAWQVAIERVLDRSTDAYLVNSSAVADGLVTRERLPATKIRVVHNGIDLTRLPPFSLDRVAARRTAGFDPQRRPQPAQAPEIGGAAPGDLLHDDAELADALRPVAAPRQHEHRRVDARAVQAADELVELILGPSLAELADHIGDPPRPGHATASSAPRHSPRGP